MASDPNEISQQQSRRLFRLLPIISLDTDAQLAIRDIRNQTSVRAVMFTDHRIGVNEHLQWISGLKHNQRRLAFAIVNPEGKPIGVVQLDDIEQAHQRADWGFYVSEDSRRIGVGIATACTFLDFAFGVLGLKKLNAQVIEGNEASVRYHLKFGFEREGFRRSYVDRDGQRLGVHLLGLTKADWALKRAEVLRVHESILKQIPITLHWEPDETAPSPIDRIEEARARNNVNWMSILRIALERSPETARQIITEIRRLDQEISALTQEIIN